MYHNNILRVSFYLGAKGVYIMFNEGMLHIFKTAKIIYKNIRSLVLFFSVAFG